MPTTAGRARGRQSVRSGSRRAVGEHFSKIMVTLITGVAVIVFLTTKFIHGAWLTPASWDKFTTRFQARGYDVEAPPWPHENIPLADLRRSPPAALASVGVTDIVDHYDKLLRGRAEQPPLVGHSFGGLFVQLLLDRGLGKIGVALDPAPIKGVMPGLDPVIGALPVSARRFMRPGTNFPPFGRTMNKGWPTRPSHLPSRCGAAAP